MTRPAVTVVELREYRVRRSYIHLEVVLTVARAAGNAENSEPNPVKTLLCRGSVERRK